MRKIPRHRRLVLLILIPPILAICLCAVLLTPSTYNFLNSAAFPDYLWSQRIARALRDKGYSIHETVNVARSERPVIDIVALGVGNLVNGKQIKPYELVKEIHSVIMETFANTSIQPQPVDIIFVIVGNYPGETYAVEVNFEDVQEFQAGKISEQAYFERWTVHSNTLEIAPP
ncbi:MAG: hypothetical protein H7Y59_14070 [Anaerolineales bacterium]|nr:hypothetical protein [Anaerolineales bacterium]